VGNGGTTGGDGQQVADRKGITVHIVVQRQRSTITFPEATRARPESNGSLTVGRMVGESYSERWETLSQFARGTWTHWTWTDDEPVEAVDLDEPS
jgi:hypothetical protein